MSEFLDTRYEKNFLTNVIFRLDFLVLDHQSICENFRSKIKSEFPIVQEENGFMQRININSSNQTLDNTQEQLKKFTFKNSSCDKLLVLERDSLTLEVLKYKDFSTFEKDVANVVRSFFECYKDIDLIRIGLRYINQIVLEKGNPFNWSDYISSHLTATTDKFFEKDQSIARSMGQTTLNYDEYKLIFNYGMFNSEFPAKIGRKEFVLDYDCFTEFVEKEKILEHIRIFNCKIKEMFENSINRGLRKMMGVKDEVL